MLNKFSISNSSIDYRALASENDVPSETPDDIMDIHSARGNLTHSQRPQHNQRQQSVTICEESGNFAKADFDELLELESRSNPNVFYQNRFTKIK